LRARSQLLTKELLDLVNSNYQDFLSLGSSLKGGDEKVEEVRVGLLGFQKEVEGVRKSVLGKEEEAQKLVDERVDVRKQIAFGRQLLDVEARLSVLEERLMVESAGKSEAVSNGDAVDISDSEETSDEDEDEDETRQFMSISKLRKHVHQYLLIRKLSEGIGTDHPFLVAQEPRLTKLRNTLLLDLSTAIKQAKGAGAAGLDRTMKIMGIYRHMDEATEAVKVLKSLRN
jgi:conserved oligomeric Golgi complex subunit 2